MSGTPGDRREHRDTLQVATPALQEVVCELGWRDPQRERSAKAWRIGRLAIRDVVDDLFRCQPFAKRLRKLGGKVLAFRIGQRLERLG